MSRRAGTDTVVSAASGGVDMKMVLLLPNGSRLSCGRPARRRKGVGRQSDSFRTITARQLQALVRPHTWTPNSVLVLGLLRSVGRALEVKTVAVWISKRRHPHLIAHEGALGRDAALSHGMVEGQCVTANKVESHSRPNLCGNG